MLSSIRKMFSGSSEELAEDVKLGPASDVKLPLKEANIAASPASTCAPEGSPGTASTPGTSLATPERRAGDSEFPTPSLDKGAFLATPSGDRFGIPPGLASGEAAKDAGAAAAESNEPEASPTAQPRQLWPNTMSGETLEEMIAGAGGPSGTPKKGVQRSPASSPTAAVLKPNMWPRTFSGEDMEGMEDFMASLPALAKNQVHSQGKESQSPKASPESSPRAQPTVWPRTMSGDDLEELAAIGMQAIAAKQAAPAAAPAFLSTTPSVKTEAPAQPAPMLPAKKAEPPAAPPSAPPAADAPVFDEEDTTPPPPEAPAATPDAKKVSIMDCLPEVEVGTEERPTVGSWGHSVGKCKPCAFFHTKGCQNGKECPFCHLCGRGEKKRRQREKWQRVREEESAQAAVAAAAAHHAALMMSPLAMTAPMSPIVAPPMPGLMPMPMPPMMPGFGISPANRHAGAYPA